MKLTIARALALLLALPARAQDAKELVQEATDPAQDAAARSREVMDREPPPPDDARPQPPAEARAPPPVGTTEVGYFDSCFGTRQTAGLPIGIYGEVPIPIGGQSSGGGLSAISGVSDDKAWLVVAVVAAAALPIVLYAVDKPAPRVVLRRFRCPSMALDILGGADTGQAAAGRGSYGFISTRLTLGAEHAGADFQYDAAPGAVSAFSMHLLLRATPREHVDGGLAIGYRRSVLGARVQGGIEIGLPHSYALWRDGLQAVALEVRPLLLLSPAIEPSLEAAFVFPLADVLHARVGGRAYTFAGDLHWGLSAGLSFTL